MGDLLVDNSTEENTWGTLPRSTVKQKCHLPSPTKVTSLVNFLLPTDMTETKHIIGLVSYYRKVVANLSYIMMPLNELNKRKTPFIWRLFVKLVSTPSILLSQITQSLFFRSQIKSMHSLLIFQTHLVRCTNLKMNNCRKQWRNYNVTPHWLYYRDVCWFTEIIVPHWQGKYV